MLLRIVVEIQRGAALKTALPAHLTLRSSSAMILCCRSTGSCRNPSLVAVCSDLDMTARAWDGRVQ